MGGWALLALVGYSVPLVLELNYLFPQRSRVRDALWRYTLRGACRTITLSESGREWLGREIGIDPSRVDVIVNGIDLDRFTPETGDSIRPRYSLGEKTIVGYLRYLWKWQGVLDVVRSAALVLPVFSRARYLMVRRRPRSLKKPS